MAQGQHGSLNDHSLASNISDGVSWRDQPVTDRTASLVGAQPSAELRPAYPHQSLSAEIRHNSPASVLSSSPQSMSRDTHHHNQRYMASQRPTPQPGNSTNTTRRSQLALPRLDSDRNREAVPTHTHYPGDGLDFRRPTMSIDEAHTQRSQVVDLTVDEDYNARSGVHDVIESSANRPLASRRQGLPRFGRNIIDVEEEPTDDVAMRAVGHDDLSWLGSFPSSRQPTPALVGDDVVITDSRPLDRGARPRGMQARRHVAAPRSLSPQLANFDDLIDLTDDNDEVIFTESRQRDVPENHGVNAQRPDMTAGHGTRTMSANAARIADIIREQPRLLHRMEAMGIELSRLLPNAVRPPSNLHHRVTPFDHSGEYGHYINRGGRPRQHRRMDMPAMMDYESIGFDLGAEGGGGVLPPTPRYSPPPKAPQGFTGNPKEDEAVVCPNCGDELIVGGKRSGNPDDEVKQQVWVVKKCGHAYCGTCATRKAAPGTRSKGKGKEKATDEGVPHPLKRATAPRRDRDRVMSGSSILRPCRFLRNGSLRYTFCRSKYSTTGTLTADISNQANMNRPADAQDPIAPGKQAEQPVETVPPSARSLYLIAYNAVSTMLWAVVLGRVVMITLLHGGGARSGFGSQARIDWLGGPNVYRGVGDFAKWTQTLAGLEVVHALIGLVRAPLLTTVMQVASRFLLVWGIVHFFPATALSPLYSTMLLAWSVTEVIRYSYFAVNLAYGKVPAVLVWARYNAFFVMYPLGISSECWLVWLATVPAKFLYDGLDWVLYSILAIYVPGSYILFTHMMAQRRKSMTRGARLFVQLADKSQTKSSRAMSPFDLSPG
nr:putative very-long-chain (3r)-3-hydroxyacyl-coa dehydratase [Quercus suber]